MAQKRVATAPRSAAAYHAFLATSRRLKGLPEARAYLQTLLDQQPRDVHLHYALALCDKEEKRYGNALEHLQRAIAGAPDFAEPFVELGSVHQAIGNIEPGLRFFLDYIRAHPHHSNGYLGLGFYYDLQSKSDKAAWSKALANYNKALALDPNNRMAYRKKGLLYYRMGNLAAYVQTNLELVARARRMKDEKALGYGYGNLGLAFKERGDGPRAIEYFKQALRAAQQVGDEQGQLEYSHETGNLLIGLNDPHQAIAYLNEALRWSQALDNPALQALTLMRLGEAYYRLEDPRSETYFLRALDLHKQQNDAYGICYTNKSLGDSQLLIGDYTAALYYYQEALERAGTDDRLREIMLATLGLAHMRKGDYGPARDFYEKALELARKSQNEARIQAKLGQLGSIDIRMNQPATGLVKLQQALEQAERTKQKEFAGFWLFRLGDAYRQLGEFSRAEACYREALARGEALQHPPMIREARKGLGQLYELLGDETAAEQYYQEVIQDLEAARNRFLLDRAKAGFIEDKLEVYERIIRLLVRRHRRQGNPEAVRRACSYAERARAQALLQTLPQGLLLKRLKTLSPAYQAWDAEYQEKRNRIYGELLKARAQWEALKKSGPSPQIHDHELAMAHLQMALDQLETEHLAFLKNKIPETLPAFAHLYGAETLDLGRVQSLLGRQEFLLAYHVQDQHTFVFVISRSDVAVVELPFGRTQKEIFIAVMERLKVKAQPFTPAQKQAEEAALTVELERFYAQLFGPLTPHLPAGSSLIIVWDDLLHYLPFGSLVMGRPGGKPKYLGQEYPISYTYSASLLNPALWAEQDPAPESMISCVLLGNPNFGRESDSRWSHLLRWIRKAPAPTTRGDDTQRLSQLPWAEAEVRDISPFYDRPVVLTGAAATEAAFRSKAPRAILLHVATHAKTDAENPWHARILLAYPGHSQGGHDGIVYWYEILELDLRHTDLVILSACETAVGKLRRGEGMDSLSRAFLYAGVPTVVASLWQVNDVATAQLMKKLHQYLEQGLDTRQALWRAQKDLIQAGYTHPHLWAAFVNIGHVRTVRVVRATPWNAPRMFIWMKILLGGLLSAALLWKTTRSRGPRPSRRVAAA